MDDRKFKAMVVRETGDKIFRRSIEEKNIGDLPPGDLVIKVLYSSLNYKDALSSIGNRGVTKNYPHTPGIDAAGVVESSSTDRFSPGDEVIVTSYDLGMNTSGGFGQYIRVPEGWVLRKPEGMTLKESMIYGTAGLTAGLSVFRLLENGTKPDKSEILVTGAAGGVGSIAVKLLKLLGFSVTAVNGLNDEADYLLGIGADRVISIEEATDKSGRPILKEKWGGCIDTIGGEMLSTAIRSVRSGGTVTCCGNVASGDLSITVYPFILRGITLAGIDSQNCAMSLRQEIWKRLSGEWKIPGLGVMADEITMPELDETIKTMLEGRHRGRSVLKNWD